MSSSSPPQGTTTTTSVNLITSAAFLLSGNLDECLTPDDESCVGGISSVMAFARNYTLADDSSQQQEPFLVIQYFDKDSPFVNMHPLLWVVNRLILNKIFDLQLFIAPPSLLLQNSVDSSVSNRDISELQSFELPLLISNVELTPSNSWYPYAKAIHFDVDNGLAIASVNDKDVPMTADQIESTKGILNYIYKINTENGCFDNDDSGGDVDGSGTGSTAYQEYLDANPLFSHPGTSFEVDEFGNVTIPETFAPPPINEDNFVTKSTCWISVILYGDVELNYWEFLETITQHENPPHLILNLEDAYEPHDGIPQLYQGTNVWVGNCPMDSETYCQHRITFNKNHNRIVDVSFIKDNLEELSPELKDDIWDTHIRKLRILADEAQANNPVIGYSGFMPVARSGSFRQCKAGECQIGNLFTDAIRWFTNTDVAFTSSGGYRGTGWPEGEVRLTDIYGGLPFPNTPCQGTMSGVSLFRVLNYTTSIATFEGEDTDNGGRLLQLSGMQVVYNTRITGSRLISVDVWDRNEQAYLPLDRLRLYTFSTDSYVCGGYDPYPELTGSDLVIEGEVPGVIGEELFQNIVADYLKQLEEPYDTSIQGRLQNNTFVFDVMNFIQDESSCPVNTVWSQELFTCFPCPEYEFVQFSDEVLEFETQSDSDDAPTGRTVLTNREAHDIAVLLKSNPGWVEFTEVSLGFGSVEKIDNTPIALKTGESLVLEFKVSGASLVGDTDRTAIGTVSFGVQDGGSYPGCSGRDATFDIALRVTPETEFNHLGFIRYIGIGLMAAVLLTAFVFSGWVFKYRNTRVVKVMQPLFLCSVGIGVVILSAAIAPMSMDDGIISERGCDIACMSIPWLVSTGFTCSFAALFSKLWRINKLFHGSTGLRRVVVTHKDVLAPFVALFSLNLIFLLTWTLVDPLRWQRFSVGGEEWNTYGACVGGTLSKIMLGLIGASNFGALFLACKQAYHARDISGEFSESKYIGVAVYGWLQIMVVGVPILFLIDRDNPTARYFLQVSLIFIVSMSMLLIIFIPVIMNFKKQQRGRGPNGTNSRVSVTGIETREDVKKRQSNSRLSDVRQSFETRQKHSSSTGSANGMRMPLPLCSINESIMEEYDMEENKEQAAETHTSKSTILDFAARAKTREIDNAVGLSVGTSIDVAMIGMQDSNDEEDR